MIRQACAALIAVSLLTACASFQVIEPREESVENKITTGDTVKIVTVDGRQFELMALDVTPEALTGKDQKTFQARRVPFDEIAMLERKNRVKQDALVYGSIAILLLVVHNNSGTLE